VRCAHGVLPVPAPATAALLRGVPVYGGDARFGELCTPTGAALLRSLAEEYGAMPEMSVSDIGIGAGSKRLDRPNIIRAFIGQSGGNSANGTIAELVCNIDDMTAEALAFACGELLSNGALDVYSSPAVMKKGRAGIVLTLLCEIRDIDKYARLIFRYTSTNGLRVRRCEKYFLAPGVNSVTTPVGTARLKTAEGFGVKRAKPEYDDAAEIARQAGLSYYGAAEYIKNYL